MVEVGVPPPAGGGIDKRTLLIGAVIIGGAIGAFMLVARKTSPSASAENKAQTDVPDQTTLGLAYQNLATQLLGFRGDVSVANAKLDQGQQDILSAVGTESADRAASDVSLTSMLTAAFSGVNASQGNISQQIADALASILGGQSALSAQNAAGFSALGTQSNNEFNALANGQAILSAQSNDQFNALAQGQANLGNQTNDEFNALAARGAGGATPRQAILAAFGAEDDAHFYLAHMSAGPVRTLTTRGY